MRLSILLAIAILACSSKEDASKSETIPLAQPQTKLMGPKSLAHQVASETGSGTGFQVGTSYGIYAGKNRVLGTNLLVYAPTIEQAIILFGKIEARFTPDPARQMLVDGIRGEEVYWTDVHTSLHTQDGWNIMLTIWVLGGANHPAFPKVAKSAHLVLVEGKHLPKIEQHLQHIDDAHIHVLDQSDLEESLKSVLRDVQKNGKGW